MQSPGFCVFEYRYRDAANYKLFERVLFSGVVADCDVKLIRDRLFDGEWFIPEQVGLEPLQGRFSGYSETPDRDDHVWHEFVTLRPATEEEKHNMMVSGEKRAVLQAFQDLAHWEEGRSRLFMPQG